MAQVIDLYKELVSTIDERFKNNASNFMGSIVASDEEEQKSLENNLHFLKENGITLTKPSQWMVLTIEEEELHKRVLRAKELGFIEAYIQNPSFLRQDVDEVMKRMSYLDHLDIAYRNEKGKYLSYLFSKRATDYVVKEKSENKENKEVDPSLKEYCDRLIEQYNLDGQREDIYTKLMEIGSSNISSKDKLISIFSGYVDNSIELSNNIDIILESYNQELKMAA